MRVAPAGKEPAAAGRVRTGMVEPDIAPVTHEAPTPRTNESDSSGSSDEDAGRGSAVP